MLYSGVISLCPDSFELRGGEGRGGDGSVNNVSGAVGSRELGPGAGPGNRDGLNGHGKPGGRGGGILC